MRVASLHAVGRSAAEAVAEQVRRLGRPASALFWLADSSRPEDIATALADVAPCVVGGSTASGRGLL